MSAPLLSRTRSMPMPSVPVVPSPSADVLDIDGDARVVTLGGRGFHTTPKEFDLLAFLVAHPRQTFTRGELLREVWASSPDWQGSATVTEHVRRLRVKIDLTGDAAGQLVTVKGVGYRFEPSDAPSGSARGCDTSGQLSYGATLVLTGDIVSFASGAAVELLAAPDCDPAAVVGRDVFEFVAPSSVGAAIARRASVEAGQWPRPEPMWMLRCDGSAVLVELASMPVRWLGEEATQVMMWTRDGRATDAT